MIRFILSIIDQARENEGKKKKNSKVECINGLLDGLKNGGITMINFNHNCDQEVQEIAEVILEGVHQRFFSPSSNATEDMVTMYAGADLSAVYTELDIYIKLVTQMIQNIAPG